MTIINLTPHTINVVDANGLPLASLESAGVARVSTTAVDAGNIGEIPIVSTVFGEVEGLPLPEEGVIYVVSALALSALAGSRADVVAPDTGPASAVRNDAGHIIGVKRFTK